MRLSEIRQIVREEISHLREREQRKSGQVWTAWKSGKWYAKSPKGETKSFGNIASARHWAQTGQSLDRTTIEKQLKSDRKLHRAANKYGTSTDRKGEKYASWTPRNDEAFGVNTTKRHGDITNKKAGDVWHDSQTGEWGSKSQDNRTSYYRNKVSADKHSKSTTNQHTENLDESDGVSYEDSEEKCPVCGKMTNRWNETLRRHIHGGCEGEYKFDR